MTEPTTPGPAAAGPFVTFRPPPVEVVAVEAVTAAGSYGVRARFRWAGPFDHRAYEADCELERKRLSAENRKRFAAGEAWAISRRLSACGAALRDHAARAVLADPAWEQFYADNPRIPKLTLPVRLMGPTPRPAGPDDFTDGHARHDGGHFEYMIPVPQGLPDRPPLPL